MTFRLTGIRERVEQKLADKTNAIWDRTWLDEAIRDALFDYSQVNPQDKIGTVTAGSDTYELDISEVTGLLSVSEVWTPYTASDPEHPPNRRAFKLWFDSKILYFPNYQVPSGDVSRIFYTALQTINGLDGASSTTVPAIDETLLVAGALGHATTSRSIDLTEKVSIDPASSQQVRAWGLSKMQEFRAGLNAVGRRVALRSSGRVETGRLDCYDGEWS